MVLDQWKLCASRDLSYIELYNLVEDPLEKKDLADKQKKTVNKLRKELDNWLASLPLKPTGNVFKTTQ